MEEQKLLKVSVAELRMIWSLGFDSGRVYGNKGASFDDQTPLWDADVNRLSWYPNLVKRIKSAQHRVQPTGGTSQQKAASKRKATTVKKVGSPTSG
jgi:hypothetical protein